MTESLKVSLFQLKQYRIIISRLAISSTICGNPSDELNLFQMTYHWFEVRCISYLASSMVDSISFNVFFPCVIIILMAICWKKNKAMKCKIYELTNCDPYFNSPSTGVTIWECKEQFWKIKKNKWHLMFKSGFSVIWASDQCCQNFRAPNRGKLAFLPPASDIKEAQFLSNNHTPHFPNLGILFSRKIIKITQLGRKTIRLLTSTWRG